MDPTSGDAISKGLIASTIGDPGPYDNDAISKGATLAPVPSGAPSQHPTFQQQPPPGYAYAPQYQQGPPVGYAPQYASQYAPQYTQGPPVGYAQQYVGGAVYTAAVPGVTFVTVASSPVFGESPCFIRCPNCQNEVTTTVTTSPGSFAWILCLVLFVLGCIPCCLIPFCCASAQDAVHSCPSCNCVVGKRSAGF